MRRGFTVIELLVVVVVVAILATLAIISYRGISDRAYYTQVVATVDAYAKALQLYKADHGQFPDSAPGVSSASGFFCLGQSDDYPAEGDWPAGSCERDYYDNAFDGFNVQENQPLNDALKVYTPNGLSGKTREVHDASYGGGYVLKYRGLVYRYIKSAGMTREVHIQYAVKGSMGCIAGDRKMGNSTEITDCDRTLR